MIINDEKTRICKEAVVAYLKLLHCHLPGETEKNH